MCVTLQTCIDLLQYKTTWFPLWCHQWLSCQHVKTKLSHDLVPKQRSASLHFFRVDKAAFEFWLGLLTDSFCRTAQFSSGRPRPKIFGCVGNDHKWEGRDPRFEALWCHSGPPYTPMFSEDRRGKKHLGLKYTPCRNADIGKGSGVSRGFHAGAMGDETELGIHSTTHDGGRWLKRMTFSAGGQQLAGLMLGIICFPSWSLHEFRRK